MATIPLPALHLNPPPDPMEGVKNAFALRNMVNQGQLQQQQLQNEQAQNQGLQMENQQRGMQNQMTAMDLQDAVKMRQLAPTFVQRDDKGNVQGYDTNGYFDSLLQNGVNPGKVSAIRQQYATMQKTLAEAGSAQLDLKTKQNNQAYQILEGVKSVASAPNADPNAVQSAYLAALPKINELGIDVSKFPTQFPGMDALNQFETGLGVHKQLLEDAKTAADTMKSSQEGRKAGMEADAMQQYGGMPPAMLESKYLALAARQKQGLPLAPADRAFLQSYEHMKTLVPTATFNLQQSALSPQATAMAGNMYSQTGQLPSGMRSPAMAGKILNAAADQNPQANIAANKATYGADAASLKSLQNTTDQMNAFEATAGKNLDNFLKTAGSVVDSGSPWVNQPLRKVAMGALGSSDMAAFNAARQTAINEISRVLASPKGSGVVSDSARNEVEGLMGPNATLKQIYSAAQILRQDMGNRRQAYADQIADIKGRMGGSSPNPGQNQGGGNADPFSRFGGVKH